MRVIEWTDQWELGEPAVWIIVAKLDAAWRKDVGLYVGPPGSGEDNQPIKYDRVREWLEASNGPVWMPTVYVDVDGVVSFTDGRHRFAWMRDHGAKAMPVTTALECAGRMRRDMGSRSRTTRIRWP